MPANLVVRRQRRELLAHQGLIGGVLIEPRRRARGQGIQARALRKCGGVHRRLIRYRLLDHFRGLRETQLGRRGLSSQG
jgi:hypothetical protein